MTRVLEQLLITRPEVRRPAHGAVAVRVQVGPALVLDALAADPHLVIDRGCALWSTPNEVVRLEVWLCHRGGLQWRRSTSLKRSSRSCDTSTTSQPASDNPFCSVIAMFALCGRHIPSS